MTKITKLSMATIVALSCLNVANAQALTEAIQNVDVSGTMAYRYNDYEGTSSASNNYKIATDIKSKINDNLTANTRVIVGAGTTNPVSITTNAPDAAASFALSEVNFSYTGLANTSIIFGKQGINTPFTLTRDAMGNEQTGTGITAISSFGPVSFYTSYYNQTNFNTGDFGPGVSATGGEDVIALGLKYSIASINLDASYMTLEDTFDVYTVGADASYDISSVSVSSFARYSSLDLDNSNQKNSLWKVGIAANMGIFGAHLSYGKTDDQGGTVGIDASSTTGFDEHWRVTLSTEENASVIYAGIDAKVTDKIKVALNYSNLSDDDLTEPDQKEIFGQVSYQMSNNLSTFVRFGQLDIEGSDKANMGRAHIQYNF